MPLEQYGRHRTNNLINGCLTAYQQYRHAFEQSQTTDWGVYPRCPRLRTLFSEEREWTVQGLLFPLFFFFLPPKRKNKTECRTNAGGLANRIKRMTGVRSSRQQEVLEEQMHRAKWIDGSMV